MAGSRYVAGLEPVEHVLNDWRTRLALHATPENRIVIIDIDERSLAEAGEGGWPWPRPTIARLLERLIDDYGVASIAVDMVLPEIRPNEATLAAQLRRPQVTGAVVYDLDKRNLPLKPPELPAVPAISVAPGAPRIYGPATLANHRGLMPVQAGHITAVFDSDGVMRRIAPMICTANADCRPSLTLTAFMSLLDKPQIDFRAGRGLLSPHWVMEIGSVDGATFATLPLDHNGMLQVPYRHLKRDWTVISAVDILNKVPDPALLKGVMVLLGGTALGMQDVITTPLNPVAIGFEPHVELLSALLDNDFAYEPKWGLLFDAATMLPFALMMVWALSRYKDPAHRAALFPCWLALTWIATTVLALFVLRQLNLLLPLLPLLIFPPLAVLLTVLAELYRSGREQAGVMSLLAAYLPGSVAAKLANLSRHGTKVDTTIDASRRNITVLFADIHGFAGITEHGLPEVVARLMQRIFTEMADAVVSQNGTIDKFIGDAIMAFWNAPDDDIRHAQNALASAFEIKRRIETLAPFCEELGIPPVSVGIGMESGEALVGNFGSAHRRTFTALGEPVVLASRLVGLTASYKEVILIGPASAALLGAAATRPIGEARIRGRSSEMQLYAPL